MADFQANKNTHKNCLCFCKRGLWPPNIKPLKVQAKNPETKSAFSSSSSCQQPRIYSWESKLYISEMSEVFYLNSTLNFGIPLVLVFQLEVCYKVDRLLTGITAQQKGTTARWYSNKTYLTVNPETISSWEYDNDYRDILRIALTSYL